MKLDRRITNGLAWAGVVLVVGVPTADLLSAQFSGDAAPVSAQVAMVAPVAPIPAPLSQRPSAPLTKVAVAKPAAQVAAVAPAKPVVPGTVKPNVPFRVMSAADIDNVINNGKKMPSYITGGGTSTTTPAPAQVVATHPIRTPIVTTPLETAPAVDPFEVAAIPPQKIAPMPMPLSMRPAPIRVPIATAAPTAPGDLVIPPGLVPVQPLETVTSADLDDWETGPLSEYLAQKQGRGSSATVTSDYDPDGFFLDQGPNPSRRDRVIGWEEPGYSFFAD